MLFIIFICWLQNIHKALDVAAMFRTLVYFYRLRDDPYLVCVCMCMYIKHVIYLIAVVTVRKYIA